MFRRVFSWISFAVLCVAASPAYARCDLLPQHKESVAIDGHKTANTPDIRVFENGGQAYTVQAPFMQIGGELKGECAVFPAGQAAVLINADTFAKRTFSLEGAPFSINLYALEGIKADHIAELEEKIKRLHGLVAQLFPLGFGEGESKSFDWLVTSGTLTGGKVLGGDFERQRNKIVRTNGDSAAMRLAPVEGTGLAVIDLPLDHTRLDEQIIHDLVRLYTQAYPHKDMGPKERRQKLSLKIDFGSEQTTFPMADYDALMAAWAGFVFAGDAGLRSELLYNKFIDYLGYAVDRSDRAHALDPMITELKNVDFIANWEGLDKANAADAYVYKYVAAPLMAIYIEKALEEAGAAALIKDLFIKVNKGEVLHFEKALSEFLTPYEVTRLLTPPRIENLSADSAAEVMMVAARRGYVNIPYPRPLNERINSMGGVLDVRLYMANPQEPARTVFVLTHGGMPGIMSLYARSYDLLSMPLIKKLWSHGDVAVVQRYSYGETASVPAEFLNSRCENPRFKWGIRSTDQHFTNVSEWLRAGGYTKVIGLGFGAGALPMLSAAASDGGYDQLFVFDPWRTMQGKVCGQDELTKVIKDYVKKIEAPVTAINGSWVGLYASGRGAKGDDMEGFMNTLFSDSVWIPADKFPAWSFDIVNGEQYPQTWWDAFEKRLKK